MVKERARQGATNSARSDASAPAAPVPAPKPRPPPPRMLSDSDFTAVAAAKKKNAPGGTATWKVDEVEAHNYKTCLNDTHNDREHGLAGQAPARVKGYETQRLEMRTFAVDRLRATAQERYGTVADLFNAMHKKEGDVVTLDEFGAFMQKRHLDANFSANDQRLMFEKFDKTFESRINVSDVLNYCGNVPAQHSAVYRDAGEVKTHVIALLETRRMASKLSLDARETKKQLRSAFRNLDPDSTGFISKEKMEWALGPEYLALDLKPDEAREAVSNIIAEGRKRKGGVKAEDARESVNYDAFVHYLGLLNCDPNYHPFYDSRSQQLTYMKRKIAGLDASINDPARLAAMRQLGVNAQSSSLSYLNAAAAHPNGAGAGAGAGTQSAPGLSGRGGGLDSPPSSPLLHLDDMLSASAGSHSASPSPDKLLSATHAPDAGTFGSPISSKTRSHKGSDKMFSKREGGDGGGDGGGGRGRPALTHSDSSHLADSMLSQMAMRGETDDRRARHQRGMWEGVCPMDTSTPLYCTQQNRFHTTSAEYFPKLTYEPSQAVQRDRVGDSSLAFRRKADRNAARAARLNANKEITSNRMKEEEFLATLRHDATDKRHATDILAYETKVLVRDMNKFKKREMEVMQRKPRMDQFGRMWGSQMQGQGREDDRDFGTTYMLGYGGSLYNGPQHSTGHTPQTSSRRDLIS
jgi:Ca2+-binding EF-hand superfamily protein